jgi:hypothetical protein
MLYEPIHEAFFLIENRQLIHSLKYLSIILTKYFVNHSETIKFAVQFLIIYGKTYKRARG